MVSWWVGSLVINRSFAGYTIIVNRLIYITGPTDVFDPHPYKRQKAVYANLDVIRETCKSIVTLRPGWLPVAPQLTFGEWLFEPWYPNHALPDCRELIGRCDAMLVLPGWEMSAVCAQEIRKMRDLNKPIYNNVSEIAKWS